METKITPIRQIALLLMIIMLMPSCLGASDKSAQSTTNISTTQDKQPAVVLNDKALLALIKASADKRQRQSSSNSTKQKTSHNNLPPLPPSGNIVTLFEGSQVAEDKAQENDKQVFLQDVKEKLQGLLHRVEERDKIIDKRAKIIDKRDKIIDKRDKKMDEIEALLYEELRKQAALEQEKKAKREKENAELKKANAELKEENMELKKKNAALEEKKRYKLLSRLAHLCHHLRHSLDGGGGNLVYWLPVIYVCLYVAYCRWWKYPHTRIVSTSFDEPRWSRHSLPLMSVDPSRSRIQNRHRLSSAVISSTLFRGYRSPSFRVITSRGGNFGIWVQLW